MAVTQDQVRKLQGLYDQLNSWQDQADLVSESAWLDNMVAHMPIELRRGEDWRIMKIAIGAAIKTEIEAKVFRLVDEIRANGGEV